MNTLQQWWADPVFKNLLSIAGIIVLAFLLYRLLNRFLIGAAWKLVRRTETTIDDQIVEFLQRFLARIFVIVALLIIGEYLSRFLGEQVIHLFRELLFVVVVFIVTTLIIRLLTLIINWYLDRIARQTQSEINREFGPLINRVMQIVVAVTGLMVVLDHFSIDAKGLIATLGVGSLAIAFAAQDTLANMIAGFVIMFDRPFRVGDRIQMPNQTVGEVYEIGLRTTKLLDFEKNLHIVPNQEIVRATVINFSYPQPLVRVKLEVGIAYGSNIEQAKEIILNIYKNHPNILGDPEPNVFFLRFGESSLDLLGVGYVDHYSKAFITGEEIRRQVYQAFNEQGIEIPFPQRTVWLQNAGEEKKN